MSAVNEEELQEIVEVVWMTALDLPIQRGEQAELAISDYLTSEIRISGAWNGIVTVCASEEFLSHAATLMFSCAADDLNDMDRTDTLTELTNMLGGTVKCLLPEICDLSLPTILPSDGIDDNDHEWVYFTCEGKPLAVAVVQSADDAQQAA